EGKQLQPHYINSVTVRPQTVDLFQFQVGFSPLLEHAGLGSVTPHKALHQLSLKQGFLLLGNGSVCGADLPPLQLRPRYSPRQRQGLAVIQHGELDIPTVPAFGESHTTALLSVVKASRTSLPRIRPAPQPVEATYSTVG